LFEKLQEYEQTGMDYYSKNNGKKRVITNPKADYEKMIDTVANQMGNPYKLIMDWIQIEIYDLIGLKESIESVHTIDKKIATTKEEINKLKRYQVDLQNEKTTLLTVWRTVTGRKMTREDCCERIIELEEIALAWEDCLEYVTYYIPMIVFPRFKRDRGAQYFEFLSSFADCHAEGATKSIDIWNQIAFFSRSNEEAENDFALTNQIRQEIIEEERESEMEPSDFDLGSRPNEHQKMLFTADEPGVHPDDAFALPDSGEGKQLGESTGQMLAHIEPLAPLEGQEAPKEKEDE